MPQTTHYTTDHSKTLTELLNTYRHTPTNILISGGSILPLFQGITIDPLWSLFLSDERLAPPFNLEMAFEYIKCPIHAPNEINEIDIAILGIGEDGHVASLFPMHNALGSLEKIIKIDDSPKLPSSRVSIGVSVLNCVKRLVFMVPKKDGKVKDVKGPHESIVNKIERDFDVYLDEGRRE